MLGPKSSLDSNKVLLNDGQEVTHSLKLPEKKKKKSAPQQQANECHNVTISRTASRFNRPTNSVTV